MTAFGGRANGWQAHFSPTDTARAEVHTSEAVEASQQYRAEPVHDDRCVAQHCVICGTFIDESRHIPVCIGSRVNGLMPSYSSSLHHWFPVRLTTILPRLLLLEAIGGSLQPPGLPVQTTARLDLQLYNSMVSQFTQFSNSRTKALPPSTSFFWASVKTFKVSRLVYMVHQETALHH